MKRYSVFLLLTLAIFVMAATLVAEVPNIISYQGRLTTPTGTPVPDASYTVVFTVYDAATGGTSKWTETQSVTTLGGLFSVPLGSVAPMSDTVFNGTTRYLGVKIGADQELTPRTALVAVPYAHRVNTVDGASGGTILGSTIITNPVAGFGNVLSLSSNATTANLDLIPQINGTGVVNVNTAGSLAFAVANNRYMTITGDGNVGIGTTSPTEKLDVSGAVRANQFRGPLVVNGGNITYAADGGDHIFTTAVQERMRITVGGNVGIGTVSPSEQLEITGNLELPRSTSGAGLIKSHDTLFIHNYGYYNTFIGLDAGNLTMTGSSNTGSGYRALSRNTSGLANTAIGTEALIGNTSGDLNTAIGAAALSHNTTGNDNSASGANALHENTIGSRNTAIGRYAMNQDTSGSNNTAIGVSSLYTTKNGYDNTSCGYRALYTNISGNYNTAIGSGADVSTGNLTNATAVGYGAVVNASNKIRLGNSAVTVIEGQVAYTYPSDRNQKENFQSVDGNDVLRKIRRMSLTSWNYKNQDAKQFRHYGPMAQDFFEAFGRDGVGTSGDSASINSGDMAGIMMIAIQTLERRTAEIERVKEENKNLRSELDDLKKTVGQLIAQAKQNGASQYGVK